MNPLSLKAQHPNQPSPKGVGAGAEAGVGGQRGQRWGERVSACARVHVCVSVSSTVESGNASCRKWMRTSHWWLGRGPTGGGALRVPQLGRLPGSRRPRAPHASSRPPSRPALGLHGPCPLTGRSLPSAPCPATPALGTALGRPGSRSATGTAGLVVQALAGQERADAPAAVPLISSSRRPGRRP